MNKLEEVEDELKEIKPVDYELKDMFYQYERLALAENVIEEKDNYHRICKFFDFKRRYNTKESLISLEPAVKFVDNLHSGSLKGVINVLEEIENEIIGETNLSSSIRKQKQKYL